MNIPYEPPHTEATLEPAARLRPTLGGLSEMKQQHRRHLAQLVRQVAAGTVPVDDLEDAAIEYDDGSQIAELVLENVYDIAEFDAEFFSGRFRGRYRLNKEQRTQLARFALFLYSDVKYTWPPLSGSPYNSGDFLWLLGTALSAFFGIILLGVSPVISIVLLGLAYGLYRCSRHAAAVAVDDWSNSQQRLGDFDVWPFRTQQEYNDVLRFPILLNGGTTACPQKPAT